MTRVLYVIKTVNEKYVIGTTYYFSLTMMYIFKYHKLIHHDKPLYLHKRYNIENNNDIVQNIIDKYIEKYGNDKVIHLTTYDRE